MHGYIFAILSCVQVCVYVSWGLQAFACVCGTVCIWKCEQVAGVCMYVNYVCMWACMGSALCLYVLCTYVNCLYVQVYVGELCLYIHKYLCLYGRMYVCQLCSHVYEYISELCLFVSICIQNVCHDMCMYGSYVSTYT